MQIKTKSSHLINYPLKQENGLFSTSAVDQHITSQDSYNVGFLLSTTPFETGKKIRDVPYKSNVCKTRMNWSEIYDAILFYIRGVYIYSKYWFRRTGSVNRHEIVYTTYTD